MVDFGNILKELRLAAGLSQRSLAEKLGITKSMISYYELQERSPSPEMLIKFSRFFHVTADYLLGIDSGTAKTLDVSDLDNEEIRLLVHTINVLRRNKIK